jgi:hypothetical protein
MIPIPLQNAAIFLQGEVDGFTMATRGVGFNTAKATIKGYDFKAKAKELISNADIYLKVREDATKSNDKELYNKINNTEWLKASKQIHLYYIPKINRLTNGFHQNGVFYGGLKYWTEKNNEEKITSFQHKIDEVQKEMVDKFKEVKFPSKYR